MKSLLLLLVFSLGLSSCSTKQVIFLKPDNAENIQQGNEVLINGLKIGEVDNVRLTADLQPLIKISIQPDIRIPVDSRFILSNQDLFGTKSIDVAPGKSAKLISSGDTMPLTYQPVTAIDTALDKIGSAIQQVVGSSQNDSLIKEVKRLNAKVEALQKTIDAK
ncbi:MAG: MCE family protein [Bacteroidetes bacterium]|nr:MCE family protein [Bacteroidota bacterium]